MAYLKPISGHGTLVGNHTRDYIEGYGRYFNKYQGKRCQKVTFINIAPDSPKVPNWAERMDADRHATGSDIKLTDKPVRTYNHYIFSPDPKDNVTVEELDKALQEWCERVFCNKFSIVIGYHNDNSNNVRHAHMIVNNVNWDLNDPASRVGNYVNKNCWEYASQLWQYMCKQRGWNNFIEKQKSDIALSLSENSWEEPTLSAEHEKLFEIDENFFSKYNHYDKNINYSRPFKKIKTKYGTTMKRPFTTKQGKLYANNILKGHSYKHKLWTDELRDLIEIAYYNSSQIPEFIETLQKLDVQVIETSNNDFKYKHPANSFTVDGSQLGSDYSKDRLIKLFRQQESFQIRKYSPSTERREILINKAREIGWTETSRHIGLTDTKTGLTVHDFAVTVRTCALFNAWDSKSLNNLINSSNEPTIVQTIKSAKATLEKLESIKPVREIWEKTHPSAQPKNLSEFHESVKHSKTPSTYSETPQQQYQPETDTPSKHHISKER